MKLVGGSSLTDADIPVSAANLSSTEIPTSYVPFRNSHLLSIATSGGEAIGARRLYIGAVAEDSAGYPGCRPDFYKALEHAMELWTKRETNITRMTPVIHVGTSYIAHRSGA